MSVSVSVVQGKVMDRLMQMVQDPQFFAGWWKKFGQPLYAQAQQNRWVTEGASEGFAWAPYSDSKYAARKLKKYADNYGGGSKMLIATSRLLASILPPPFRGGAVSPEGVEAYQEITSDSGVVISSNAKTAPPSPRLRKSRGGHYGVNYGVFVNERRPFTKWGSDTRASFGASFKTYLSSGARSGS